jgi:hypothetical protein
MAERFGLSRRKVSQLIADISVESDGRLPAGRRHEHDLVHRNRPRLLHSVTAAVEQADR